MVGGIWGASAKGGVWFFSFSTEFGTVSSTEFGTVSDFLAFGNGGFPLSKTVPSSVLLSIFWVEPPRTPFLTTRLVTVGLTHHFHRLVPDPSCPGNTTGKKHRFLPREVEVTSPRHLRIGFASPTPRCHDISEATPLVNTGAADLA